MPPKTIAIAADHAGYGLKQVIARYLADSGRAVCDLGTDSEDSVDYPDFANALAEMITSEAAWRGILVCGSGIGMSIAANRHSGVRAALVHNLESAILSRRHNDANVLVFAGRMIEEDVALACVDAFLSEEFEGGRHQRRVGKLA